MTYLSRFLMFLVVISLTACASLWSSYETPQVNITSISLAPQTESSTPSFRIGLQVINPNRRALPLQGMSYSLEVDGQRIISGAEPDLPHIPGYGTADISIQASPDLLGSARLLNQLLSGQRDSLAYRFKARLDVGSLLPFITVEEEGVISFGTGSEDPTI